MSKGARYLLAGIAAAVLVALLAHARGHRPAAVRLWMPAGRPPQMHPDYSGVTVPPNIAPLNFVVDEPARECFAHLWGGSGAAIDVTARAGSVRMPPAPWRALLAANAGHDIRLDVFTTGADGRRTNFETVIMHVAPEPVDPTLVYRLLKPAFNKWSDLGIYQRDLTSFAQKPILRNRNIGYACLNCHTFAVNKPDRFLFHIRRTSGNPAMILVHDGKAEAVDTRAPGARGIATYSAWHPSGKVIAFSANKIRQFFHTAGTEPRDVVDLDSGLRAYRVDTGKFLDHPSLDQPRMLETFPNWSPDGKYLYFSRAPMIWAEPKPIPMELVPKVKYDLVRVSFDIESGAWGKPEVVLPAKALGKSLLEPRVSPDGRFLLFTVCDYGSFPVFQTHSDLYLMDLEKPGRPYRRLQDAPESLRDSWHSWSSNGRWVCFSRKHQAGVVARPHLCYIDAEGNPAKPFVVPQEDPSYYDRCYQTYNVPELVTGPVTISEQDLVRAVDASEEWKAAGQRPPAGEHP